MPAPRPHPESSRSAEELIGRAGEVLPGGNTRTTLFVPPHPPYAVTGSGYTVVDTDGHEAIDCNNNYTSLIHGHCQPAVQEAARRAIDQGASVGLPTPGEVELADELTQRVSTADRWRFTNSGTEAVMLALRLARAATGRRLVLRFSGSYHGSSDQVVDPGKPGVSPGAAADTIVVPHEDESELRAALSRHGTEVACVLIDLMPNRAGLRPREPGFVEMVRAEADAVACLLVVDEVITSRLEVGGLQRRYDLTPDLTVLGKSIGGGFPVGAVGGLADLMDRFDPRRTDRIEWGGTFNANPVSMAAGMAALRDYRSDDIARLNSLGDALRERLRDSGLEVTGSGSLLRLHSAEPTRTWWRSYRSGLLLGTNGLLSLSTPMTAEVTDRIYKLLVQAGS